MNYLHIIKNNEVMTASPEELFDHKKYHTIRAISYVSSPSFFFRCVKGFEKVELILGIEEEKVLSSFSLGFAKVTDIEFQMEFWNDLNETTKNKIRDNKYHIRYPFETPIHSKFYLLEGKNDYCVMMGSANFTQRAFTGKQYEELFVFENDRELYDLYMERFNLLKATTVDYISDKIKKKENQQQVMIHSEELAVEIMMDEIDENRDKYVITEEIKEKIVASEDESKEQLKNSRRFVQTVEVLENKATKKIRTTKDLVKSLPKLRTVLSQKNKRSTTNDTRFPLHYNVAQDELYTKVKDNGNDILVSYGKKLEKEEIEREIDLIEQFIHTYGKFSTKQPNLATQKRIYEVIFYTFLSPFIWKFRDHYIKKTGLENKRGDIKPFLVISGPAGSGKSNAAIFAAKLVNNHQSEIPFHNEIESYIHDYFYSDIVTPIFVDEVQSKFFSGKTGETFIKKIANARKGVHPVMIGTTNTDSYTVEDFVNRRVYYLLIKNSFNLLQKNEAEQTLQSIMDQANDTLFKDFTLRMKELLNSDKEFFQIEDMLYAARTIFKAYYQEIERPLPDFFPEHMFNDYIEQGKQIWKDLFLEYQEAFTIRDNFITVKKELMPKNSSIYKDDFSKLLTRIPTNCIEEKEGVLKLNKKFFFEFIEYDETNTPISIVGNASPPTIDIEAIKQQITSELQQNQQPIKKESFFKRLFKK